MRVDNDGEGGILALMSLLGVKLRPRPFIAAVGLMGAALIYGDGAITPAISVLSALEGLNIVTPDLEHYILPLAVIILVALFAIQHKGTARIGKAFGPIMVLWFVSIGILGVWGIVQHPSVLFALNPLYGLTYLVSHGMTGFLVLGGVFLCVTGAEALYADMGHFGVKPIHMAWFWLVFPCLLLNYAGQAALALEGAPISDNIFYRLCPPILLGPFVLLATVATIIASQSIITGAFSMTRQAVQLGWLPRLQITQTSAEGYGQIYVGIVNWLLMIVTVGLAVGFGESDNLASAYGIAVSATMLATSILLFVAMREIWKWSLLKAGTVAGLFMIVDTAFFTANLSKLLDGGYVPIMIAAFICCVMYAWRRGVNAVSTLLRDAVVPVDQFTKQLTEQNITRVPGTAIFFTRTEQDTPPVMSWFVERNHSLHQKILILKVSIQSTPWLKDHERLTIKKIAPNIWRAAALYGFMERPNIPELLRQAHGHDCPLDLKNVTYYIGHETIIPSDEVDILSGWIEASFVFMQRNSARISDYFQLPVNEVVEIGRQIVV
jgi:KUP system potassium uptake protein